ncbi:MAG: thioredoxin fold domain-containing protein [Acaryochloris sp. RU_4_1]|nr:thioredoxin fold domain-containing protein [Acaryochloris sp. RU_4_1]NJR55730.1 thioredoxin fold domain-containing protein [Acaryochloris sp. CRU_2_0]
MTSDSSNPSPTADANLPTPGSKRLRNFLVAIVAIALSTILFLGSRQHNQQPSLSTLAAHSTPLDIALTNEKPTLMEFYANWCTSCQAMADDMHSLEKQFADEINFVMLNVDNSKWLPEILKFKVNGIPHFVFLNAKGEALASSIGQQPRSILSENLTTLVTEGTLSTPAMSGPTSLFQPAVKGKNDDPRSHGGLSTNAEF